MKKLYIMGCTHGHHQELTEDIIKKNPDILIHTGDFSNSGNLINNIIESEKFLNWYNNLNVKAKKILIAGNHDTALFKKQINFELYENIIYLEDSGIDIEGTYFYGTPWMSVYGNWSFMLKENSLEKIYSGIPEKTDVLITHSPPKYINDLSYKPDRTLEFCGNKHLLNKVNEINPKAHCFSHIHDNGNILNRGIKTIRKENDKVINFINVACCKDREMDKLKHKGITFFI